METPAPDRADRPPMIGSAERWQALSAVATVAALSAG